MAAVECRSDTSYAQRPTAVHWDGQRWAVAEVLAEWRTPAGKQFRVRAAAGPVFELTYSEALDEWQVRPI
ncbi:MAG: hypothetical protein JNK29_15365 [Anaerolineales bacterium]|nr:hypothetical protein [Anaerolineales bacterium]